MKILSNKFVLFTLVIAIVAGIILLPPLISGGGGKKDKSEENDVQPCDEKTTPRYCELQKRIIELGKANWNKSEYRVIAAQAEDWYSQNYINKDQYGELKRFLNSKYLGVLSTAIKEHCRIAKNLNNVQLSEFESSLKTIPADPNMRITVSTLSGLITNFRSAVTMPDRVKSYLASEYSINKTAKFRDQIAGFKKAEIINTNLTILNQLATSMKLLNAYDEQWVFIERTLNDESFNGTGEELRDICTISGIFNKIYYDKIIKR